jgi:hypothetical protein
MVMDTSLVVHPGVLHAYIPQEGGAAVPSVRLAEQANGVRVVQGSSPEGPTLAGGDYGQLRARQDGMNELAQAIRSKGGSVDLRKLFPPYPPEQKDRMAYLDKISGLRRQIEALMFTAVQGGEPDVALNDLANASAKDLSQDSKKLLAALDSKQSISSNRPLLEVVAQIEPVQ